MILLKRILYFFNGAQQANSSPTVRYAFPVVLGAIAFLGAQAIVSQSATEIRIVPSTNSVRAGEVFSLDVYVSAATEVNAVDLELSFPAAQMKVSGIDTGESVITLWTEEPYVKENVVFLRGGTFRRGFVGEHLIATINAKALDSGIAKITVDDFMLLAGDGSGSEVTVLEDGIDTAQVYIAQKDGTFTPGTEPSTGTVSGSVTVSVTTDIDGDGEVDLGDVSRFMSAWFNKATIFDFNNDGAMSFTDFGIVLSDSFFR